jgi:hypothetical protein
MPCKIKFCRRKRNLQNAGTGLFLLHASSHVNDIGASNLVASPLLGPVSVIPHSVKESSNMMTSRNYGSQLVWEGLSSQLYISFGLLPIFFWF